MTYRALSDKSFRIDLAGIPAGRTATKLYFAIKRRPSDSDAEALFMTSAVPSGLTATIKVPKDSGLDPGAYWFSTKMILDDGDALATSLYGEFLVLDAGIEAVA